MILQLAFCGDSLTQGQQGGWSIAQGGQGSWPELVAERLSNLPGVGPLLSSGMRGAWMAFLTGSSTEWAFSGSGTGVATTDAFYKTPYGLTGTSPTSIIKYASGSTNVWTATLPIYFRAAVGFTLYYIDYTSGGNWSYSTDGGTTYTNMGQTLANNNLVRKFYVSTAITPGNTVKIKAANSSNTAQGCLPIGIEWFYQTVPTGTSGLICHNLGVNGSELNYLVTAGSGDPMAWFDSVVGAIGTITNQPSFITCMHINDVLINNTTTYASNLSTFNTRLSPFASILYINPYEVNTGIYNATNQASYRAQLLSSASGFTQPTLDIYTNYANTGWTGNTATFNAGLLNSDQVHESQLGHFYIANYVYWAIRNLLGVGNVPSTYTVKGIRPTVYYYGQQTDSDAYQAGSLIGVGPV